MSSAAMTLVFAHSTATGVARLVALSLANNYSQQDDYAVASLETVCRETAATPEQVERAVRKLVALREWQVVRASGDLLVMRQVIACPLDCDRSALHLTSWTVGAAS